MINNERNDMEITTDTFGIPMRNYQDTLCTRYIMNNTGITTTRENIKRTGLLK